MGRQASVGGDGRPAVLQHPHLEGTGVDHRLDGDHHTADQSGASAGLAIVRDLRLLVQMLTNTVADEVTDDSAAERFGIGLHGMPDIRDPASLAREFHALEKALLRDINKPLRFGRDLPAGIGCGAVPMESLPFGSRHRRRPMSPSCSTRPSGMP